MTESASLGSSRVHVVSWLLLAVALLAAGFVAGRGRSEPRSARADAPAAATDPIGLVPAGPRLLISADLQGLVQVAAEDLARVGGQKLLGLRDVCGFEPLLSLHRAVFAVPFGDGKPEGRNSDFALIAESSLQQAAGLRCAELVIKKRGGSPGTTRFGAFASVRDLRRPLGEVALRTDGMFVLSGGQYFRDVMDVALGTARVDAAAQLRSRLHASLRSKLGPAQLHVTWLPDETTLFPGVLAVGLAVQIDREISLSGLLLCKSTEACTSAREMVAGASKELAANAELSGLSTLEVAEQPNRLELSAKLPRSQLGPLLAQLASP